MATWCLAETFYVAPMEESIIYQTASRKEHTIKSNMLKKKAEQKGSPNVYNFLGHFPLILTLHLNI